jgi:serine/threonine-protein phosphatase 5
MNIPYGFEKEARVKLGADMFLPFSKAFEYLPVGHVLSERVLVVHGGLFRDQTVTMASLQTMSRFGQPPDHGAMNDILWSDPMDGVGFAPSPRGVTVTFGSDVTERFLRENGLQLLIRSHQLAQEGYLVQHGGKCITVFSAPNYIGRMGNRGAIVVVKLIDGAVDLQFLQFQAQPIPRSFPPMMYASPMVMV